jgi:pimeloyl-ACP methyl ester carboxylesterase
LPTLAVRGALSDVLSDQTLREMEIRHPRLSTLVVPGQGHAPLLREPETHKAIADFLATADANR